MNKRLVTGAEVVRLKRGWFGGLKVTINCEGAFCSHLCGSTKSLTVNYGFSVIMNVFMGALKAEPRVILSFYKVLFKTHARASTSSEPGAIS